MLFRSKLNPAILGSTAGFSFGWSGISIVGLIGPSLTAEQLDEDAIERYRRYLKRRKRVRSEDVCTLFRLLDLLREQGVTPRRTIEAVPTAREILLEKYRHYLSEERGLSEASLRNMLLFKISLRNLPRLLISRMPVDHTKTVFT